MTEGNSVTVKVPATTANLGPGFDCLGLALDLWNEVTVSVKGSKLDIEISGEGQKELPVDANNLIYRAIKKAAGKYQREMTEGLVIRCQNDIPISSGLGSSASAIITGLLAARKLFSLDEMSNTCLLGIGLDLEDHADNISACLLGGLVVVIQDGDSPITQKIDIQPMHVTVAFPQVQLSTLQARKILPISYSREDTIFNIGRTAAVVAALSSGDPSMLAAAMQDRIHQPYRLRLISGAQEALNAAMEAGALGAALSGAGPSLIAFHDKDNEEIGSAMKEMFDKQKIQVRILELRTSNAGAFVV